VLYPKVPTNVQMLIFFTFNFQSRYFNRLKPIPITTTTIIIIIIIIIIIV